MPHIITIDDEVAGTNIKQFFRLRYPHLPYPLLKTWLRKGEVKLNGKKITAEQLLQLGDKLKLPPPHFMTAPSEKPTVVSPIAARDKLSAITLATTDDYIVINKPAGLAVQGGSGIGQSLDDWLIALNRAKSQTQYKLVHRLDRDTSGVMLIAKHRQAAQDITAQFHQHLIQKTYLAVVRLPDQPFPTRINAPLRQATTARGSKLWERMVVADQKDDDALPAETLVKKISEKNNLALLELNPLSGRKHQLRVHLAHVGAPIIGDKKYGADDNATANDLPNDFLNVFSGATARHLLLHARAITLPNGQQYHAPAPDYFPLDYFDKNLL
ncbi:MAG: RluA family pseudouridine synthase [Hydrotalea sp.]|nr:RluA family pseudouridine synthase [Hydrotalea sp.]